MEAKRLTASTRQSSGIKVLENLSAESLINHLLYPKFVTPPYDHTQRQALEKIRTGTIGLSIPACTRLIQEKSLMASLCDRRQAQVTLIGRPSSMHLGNILGSIFMGKRGIGATIKEAVSPLCYIHPDDRGQSHRGTSPHHTGA